MMVDEGEVSFILPSWDEEEDFAMRLVELGCLDSVTRRVSPTVCGRPLRTQLRVFEKIRRVCETDHDEGDNVADLAANEYVLTVRPLLIPRFAFHNVTLDREGVD